MLATTPQLKKRIPPKQWLNLDSYKSKFKPSKLTEVPASETIEYLQEIEFLRIYRSGKIYDYND